MSQHYYFIRIYDDEGKPLSTRCEKASGPREACRLAFGVVYDRPTDTARYLDIGTRAPRNLSQKKLRALEEIGLWQPIPPKGA